MLGYDGAFLIPGHGEEFFTQENQLTWGPPQQQLIVGSVIDSTCVDSGNTSYTNILRPGLALGMLSASQKVVHWNPYATDGSQRLFGFYMGNQNMNLYGVATSRLVGGILVGGNVLATSLIIPGETTAGISGKDYEFLLREQMEGRFNVDDDLGRITGWKVRVPSSAEITAHAVTLTAADHNTWYQNVGETAASTVNLPAPRPGLHFRFSCMVDFNITLDGPATGEFLSATHTTGNTEVIDEDDKQIVDVYGIRTTGTTYKYKCVGVTTVLAEA
jgi:hypothetical protein